MTGFFTKKIYIPLFPATRHFRKNAHDGEERSPSIRWRLMPRLIGPFTRGIRRKGELIMSGNENIQISTNPIKAFQFLKPDQAVHTKARNAASSSMAASFFGPAVNFSSHIPKMHLLKRSAERGSYHLSSLTEAQSTSTAPGIENQRKSSFFNMEPRSSSCLNDAMSHVFKKNIQNQSAAAGMVSEHAGLMEKKASRENSRHQNQLLTSGELHVTNDPSSRAPVHDVPSGQAHPRRQHAAFPMMDIAQPESDQEKDHPHPLQGSGQDSPSPFFHHQKGLARGLGKADAFNKAHVSYPFNPAKILNPHISQNFSDDHMLINDIKPENSQQSNITGEIWIDTVSLQDWFQEYISGTLRNYTTASGFENAFMAGS